MIYLLKICPLFSNDNHKCDFQLLINETHNYIFCYLFPDHTNFDFKVLTMVESININKINICGCCLCERELSQTFIKSTKFYLYLNIFFFDFLIIELHLIFWYKYCIVLLCCCLVVLYYVVPTATLSSSLELIRSDFTQSPAGSKNKFLCTCHTIQRGPKTNHLFWQNSQTTTQHKIYVHLLVLLNSLHVSELITVKVLCNFARLDLGLYKLKPMHNILTVLCYFLIRCVFAMILYSQ